MLRLRPQHDREAALHFLANDIANRFFKEAKPGNSLKTSASCCIVLASRARIDGARTAYPYA